MKKMSFEQRINKNYQLDLKYVSEREPEFLKKKEYLEELFLIIASDYWNDKGVEFQFFCCDTVKIPTFIGEARHYLDEKNEYLRIEDGVKNIERLAKEASQRNGFYRHHALVDLLHYINTPENERPAKFFKPNGLKNKMQIESDFSFPSTRTSYHTITTSVGP